MWDRRRQAQVAVVGASGHACVVAECVQAATGREAVLFERLANGEVRAPWTLGGDESLLLQVIGDFWGFIVAISDNNARLQRHRHLAGIGGTAIPLVHPAAYLSPHATLQPGSVMLAGSAVNVGCSIAEAVIINTRATVGVDCNLQAGVHLAPGVHVGNEAMIGERSLIGIGAVVRDGVTIGRDVTVGAGAVVLNSIPDRATAVGNPAQILEGHTE